MPTIDTKGIHMTIFLYAIKKQGDYEIKDLCV